MDPSFLYGPLLSVKFLPKWTVSNSFLFGSYSATANTAFFTSAFRIPTDYSVKTDRYDLDSTLNYAITSYIKVFAGLKIQGYSFKMDAGMPMIDLSSGVSAFQVSVNEKSSLFEYGPGAGIAAGIPVFADFFLLCNVSGVYMFATRDETMDITTIDLLFGASPVNDSTKISRHYRVYGANTSLSLAYYFPSTRITVAFGGRYQYLMFKAMNSGTDMYG